MKSIVGAVIIAAAALTIAGCSSPAPAAHPAVAASVAPKASTTPTPAATLNPVAQAITDRYGDCLVKLGLTEPFTIDVYPDMAVVSGSAGVVTFHVAKSNTGSLLTAPVDTDNSARALASVGC